MASNPSYLSNVVDPNAPLTEQQRQTIILPTEGWTNQYASTIVNDAVSSMEQYNQQTGNLSRWTGSDEMFVAWRAQRLWEGTRKPKARIPVFLLFSQLQALLPNLMSALLPLHENIDVAPRPGSTLENAQAALELIMAQLDSLGEEGLTRFRAHLDPCLTQGLLYGTGVMEITWLFKVIKRLAFMVDWQPQLQPVFDQLTYQTIMAPVGPPQRIVREVPQEFIINQPDIKCIDVRDFGIDPQCPSPRIQDARWCYVRSLPTVGELISYRGQPGFMIPDDLTLIKLAEDRTYTAADASKRSSGSVFGQQYDPGNDYIQDPYLRRVECVRWYSRERNVWLFNRRWVGFNWANPYGFLPFLNAFYVPFPNRFHGISLADVVEGDQSLIASLLESRMDELSLAINAPFVRKQGTMIGNQGSLPMSPSKVIDVNDSPKDAIVRLDVQSQTQQAFIEANDAYSRSARTTGLSDTVVMGVPQAGGNSAQRTATGVDALKAAAGTRITYLVENIESSLIEPLCIILHQFNIKFQPRDRMVPITGTDGKPKEIDPVQVLNALPRFTMRASGRMRTRQALAQVLPWLTQTFLNPEFMSVMAQQYKKKLHLPNMVTLIMDTIQAPKIELFIDMTPEEIQQLNQPSPDAQMAFQQQQARLQAQAQRGQEQDDTGLLSDVIRTLGTPRAVEDALGFEDAEAMKLRARQQTARSGNGAKRK